MIALALGIYVAGAAIVALLALRVIAHEPTAHGQGVMLPFGCGAVLLWPLVLVYLLFIGAVVGVSLLFGWRP